MAYIAMMSRHYSMSLWAWFMCTAACVHMCVYLNLQGGPARSICSERREVCIIHTNCFRSPFSLLRLCSSEEVPGVCFKYSLPHVVPCDWVSRQCKLEKALLLFPKSSENDKAYSLP